MALWECAECTTKYSVGAPKCPECGSTLRVNEATQPPEEDEDMPKITVHGGPSDAIAEELEAGEDESATADASPASEDDSSEQAESGSPQRARTTASRSKKARTE